MKWMRSWCISRPELDADQNALSKLIIDKLTGATEVAPNDIEFIPLGEMVKRLELETANKEKRILDVGLRFNIKAPPGTAGGC